MKLTKRQLRRLILEAAYDYFGDKGTGRQAKKDWAAKADQESLQTLVYVHWAGVENIEKLINNQHMWRRNELSASIYRQGDILEPPTHMAKGQLDMAGVILSGYITFAANRDLYSGWTMAKEYEQFGLGKGTPDRRKNIQQFKQWAVGDWEKMHRTASSGWGKVPTTREAPWAFQKQRLEWLDHIIYDVEDLEISDQGVRNEALIDNWTIVKVIKPGDIA